MDPKAEPRGYWIGAYRPDVTGSGSFYLTPKMRKLTLRTNTPTSAEPAEHREQVDFVGNQMLEILRRIGVGGPAEGVFLTGESETPNVLLRAAIQILAREGTDELGDLEDVPLQSFSMKVQDRDIVTLRSDGWIVVYVDDQSRAEEIARKICQLALDAESVEIARTG